MYFHYLKLKKLFWIKASKKTVYLILKTEALLLTSIDIVDLFTLWTYVNPVTVKRFWKLVDRRKVFCAGEELSALVCDVVKRIGFKESLSSGTKVPLSRDNINDVVLSIVQDADRLDAIGASFHQWTPMILSSKSNSFSHRYFDPRYLCFAH